MSDLGSSAGLRRCADNERIKRTYFWRANVSDFGKHGNLSRAMSGTLCFAHPNTFRGRQFRSQIAVVDASSSSRLVGTDEVAGPPEEEDKDSIEAGGIPNHISPSGDNIDTLKSHPGPVVRTEDILKEDLSWKDIGSGTFSKTFRGATRLWTTTRGGPPAGEVYRRTIWSLSSGNIIDDCFPEDVPDELLHRELRVPDDIRVEFVMKDALQMYTRKGADVSEVYSQPRVAQEASLRTHTGQKLQPGWSLDLTRLNPSTGDPWDLSCPKVQSRAIKMLHETSRCS